MDYLVRMKELRDEQGLKQEAIADYLHVAQTTYSEYERDIIRISAKNLIELTRYYNVDMNYASTSNYRIDKIRDIGISVKHMRDGIEHFKRLEATGEVVKQIRMYSGKEEHIRNEYYEGLLKRLKVYKSILG